MPKHAKKMKARGGMARGGVQAASIGGDIGQWIGDWFQSWLGFAEGGAVHSRAMARGGMARGGMANYEDGGSLEDWNGKPLGKGERWEKIKSVFY